MILNRKSVIIISLALIIIVLTAGYIISPNNNEKIEVDLSDIEEMNIGTDIPILLYADNSIVIIQGTFGVIVYDIHDSVVTNRISYEDIKQYGISMIIASVAQDGATIYIGNDDMYNKFIFTHQYDIKTGKIKKTIEEPISLFKPIAMETPYYEQYSKYFDLGYLIGHMIVELDDSFIYTRSPDWNMKNLQIVICQYESGESRVLDIFKFTKDPERYEVQL